MRVLSLAVLTVLTILTAVCIGQDKPAATFVDKPGFVSYYTTLDAALAAAKDGQFVVIGFYTDW